MIQNITKRLERYGIKFSDYLIADNIGIKEYIKKEYNRTAEFIPYGALKPKKVSPDILDYYKMKVKSYYLSIARLEPENNLEMMFDAYIVSKILTPYFVVGNHLTAYGDFLKDKLEPHPNHPNGRNPYAHICLLINQKFSCSYKDVCDDEVEQLKRFILSINK